MKREKIDEHTAKKVGKKPQNWRRESSKGEKTDLREIQKLPKVADQPRMLARHQITKIRQTHSTDSQLTNTRGESKTRALYQKPRIEEGKRSSSEKKQKKQTKTARRKGPEEKRREDLVFPNWHD